MDVEMWHLFIISNVILLFTVSRHLINHGDSDRDTIKYLHSCLFTLISIGLVTGTFIASVLYANMESNVMFGNNNPIILAILPFAIPYFMFMSIPLILSIPEKEDFETAIKKHIKLN